MMPVNMGRGYHAVLPSRKLAPELPRPAATPDR